MRTVSVLLLALATASLGATCNSPVINPPTGPGTEFPCGVWGVECPGDTCCPPKHECGGDHRGLFSTCPEGYCCYEGGDDWPRALPSDGGIDASRWTSIVRATPRPR